MPQGSNVKCFECGALMPIGMEACPACDSTAFADRIEAETEIHRQEEARQKKNLDMYRLNERYMATLNRARLQVEMLQKDIKRRLENLENLDERQVYFLHKASAGVTRELGNLANAQSKMTREQLSQQVARSKIVTEMSLEQQFAYLLEWARKLAQPYRTMFIEQLRAMDEKMLVERAAKRAAKGQAKKVQTGQV